MEFRRIGEILIENGLIDEDKLRCGLEEQLKTKDRLASTLVKLGYISERDMLSALSMQLGIPFVSSQDYPKEPPSLDPLPPIKFLKQYNIVPIELKDGTLRVAMANPTDMYPVEALTASTGLDIYPILGAEKDIVSAIEANYGNGVVTMGKIIEGMKEKDSGGAEYESENIEQLKDMAQEAPIINLVNLIITKAVEKRASDIHIEPFEDKLHVRYRIDGILQHTESPPRGLHPAIASRIKIMAKLNIAERRVPQDGRIKIKAAGKDIDIRVSTVPTLYGESIVMRLLDTTGIVSMESIGFSNKCLKTFEGLVRQPHGMVLVTGPTGSGKSTTLYAALSKMDTRVKKVITIEDPVEYYLAGVNQIQVKPKVGLTFANGLRSVLRQDPDVIMVGEIRDADTAGIAIHAALTGHLVLSTLHTNDAPSAITRLIDIGMESYLVSSCLIGILAQRLVRVICGNCKKAYKKADEAMHGLNFDVRGIGQDADTGFMTYKGEGCEMCAHTGYSGRRGIFELMVINDDLRQLIVEKKSASVLRQKAVELGMTSIRQDGWEKVRQGLTTVEEIARVTLEEA